MVKKHNHAPLFIGNQRCSVECTVQMDYDAAQQIWHIGRCRSGLNLNPTLHGTQKALIIVQPASQFIRTLKA